MAAISFDATNPENYVRGQGIVYFQPEGIAGVITDFPVGNCTAFDVKPTIEILKHKSRMAARRVTDRTDVIESSATVKMIMEAWTPRNMQLMLMGVPDVSNVARVSIPILAEDAVRGHLMYVGTNSRGPQWTIDLPVVEFTPSGSLDPLANEWAQMEVTGDVIYANNTFGEAFADFSAGSAVPVNTIPPTVYGTAALGQVLTALRGSWTGFPTLYTYQWQRDAGAGFIDIAGATAVTYTVAAPVVATNALRVAVIAHNTTGASAAANSAKTANVP